MADDAARRRFAAVSVVRAQSVPAVKLERFRRQLHRPVLREPWEDGLQGVLFARAGLEGLVAAEARGYAKCLAAMLAQAPEGADEEVLVGHRLADVERRVPGRQHREVFLVEVLNRLGVVDLQLVVGNFVHPCAHDFPEELAAGLTADRFRHNADCFLRLYEAEWHPGPISL